MVDEQNNLKHHWRYEKMMSLDEAAKKSAELRAQGKTIVTVNGSFDLLQAGHLDFLEEAKQQGDVLFVGINTDDRVMEKKGKGRPIIPQQERMAMVAALACVDYVIPIEGSYDEEPHGSFLPAIQPHIHVNGSDYDTYEQWVEWPTMKTLGIKPYMVTRRPNLSTSGIVQHIKNEL